MSLFQKQEIVLHSGIPSDFKIDCDDLSYADVETLCYLISQKFQFYSVFGVPSGGLKFADCLKKYCLCDPSYPTLIVDDVLTTGGSMNGFLKQSGRKDVNYQGVVIFARGKCPNWVTPIFQMW